MTELISATSDPDPTAGSKIRFFTTDGFAYYIRDKETLDNTYAFYAINGRQKPLLKKANSVVFGVLPDTTLFLILFNRRCYRLSVSEKSVTFVNLDILKYFPGTKNLT